MFEIPSSPKPRDRFFTRVTTVEGAEGAWATLRVEIIDTHERVVASYDRNHPNLYRTFEPFRQGDRIFALISQDYTATSVMDLSTGKVIASEEPHSEGFCPAGFYVPDWWDVHDGSILAGSMDWNESYETPTGDFGFVWGCIWGDDSSWKVQYLDLAQIQDGKISRDDRFGYVELADDPRLSASDFIQCSFYSGEDTVTFASLNAYDLHSGKRKPHEFE